MTERPSRRDVLKAGAVAGLAGALGCSSAPGTAPLTTTAPAVFISHGSPMTALADDDYTRSLRALAASLPRLRAFVVVSAHWLEGPPIRVSTSARPPMIYDFFNFPKRLYELRYGAPGDPALGGEVLERLRAEGLAAEADAERGYDHGCWVPLRIGWPAAEVPVVQVSLNSMMNPTDLLEVGRALAPLRRRGVMVIGSGGMTHNFSMARDAAPGEVDEWARAFEEWVMERAAALDGLALTDYLEQAPEAETAHPTTEHFDPIFVVMGAALPSDRLHDVYRGFRSANFSMRSFAIA